MFLARAGEELDLRRFQLQQGELQQRQLAATRRASELRAAVDAAQRAVADAKERYAATRLAAATARN